MQELVAQVADVGAIATVPFLSEVGRLRAGLDAAWRAAGLGNGYRQCHTDLEPWGHASPLPQPPTGHASRWGCGFYRQRIIKKMLDHTKNTTRMKQIAVDD